ncbi:unnamed protein product [Blumeria hordei]|uniref:V-type proton ATPase subunit G n=1 Tax=Blumeria hordei TaxID=2867405 RepID=A0A383US27_BLUHO|nr:unnamed protein product [Blumeria hordei]
MSAQNSAGIQTLLDAERDAQKIVQKDRTKRVKEARDEAKKEVDAYKAKKDLEFKTFESEHVTNNKKAEEDAISEADSKMKQILEFGKKGEGEVIRNLLGGVFEVTPVVPKRVEVIN